jgi:23S rRNA pseudouridine955/2504/2580 synthase
MISWKAENQNRLLTEIKNKCSANYSVKDLRWSLEHNRCFVNKKIERFGSTSIRKGDLILFHPEKKPNFCKEELRILYEDTALLVYDKPPFLTSENLATITETQLVHRLDRDTSGVVLLAKDQRIGLELEKQFRERSIQKEYFAIVEGFPGKEGVIQGNMAPLHKREGAVIWGMATQGVWSKTAWECLRQGNNKSLLHCYPLTGRTHQIRVHLQHIGGPILGDYTYGAKQVITGVFRPLLHAHRLLFVHPLTGKSLSFTSEPPSDFFPL